MHYQLEKNIQKDKKLSKLWGQTAVKLQSANIGIEYAMYGQKQQ